MSAAAVCAACGLPPDSAKPLLRCSICRSVYYHDQECQRAHYAIHRKSCRKDTDGRTISSPFKVVQIEGKGKGVRSLEKISTGMLVASIDPIVPPVLVRQRRQTHCALCLQPVSSTGATKVSEHPKYYVIVCRNGCHHASTRQKNHDPFVPQWLTKETEAVKKVLASFYPPTSPVQILPTALLIYRIERSGIHAIDEMQSHERPLSEDAAIHRKALTALVQQFFLVSELAKLPSPERITLIHNAIKYNSFSIVHDKTDDAIGIGLYRAPSYRINHSCVPNTRQSFQGIKLLLHATEAIETGDEISINYCDSEDATQRRKFLANEYCFSCSCQLCALGKQNSHSRRDSSVKVS